MLNLQNCQCSMSSSNLASEPMGPRATYWESSIPTNVLKFGEGVKISFIVANKKSLYTIQGLQSSFSHLRQWIDNYVDSESCFIDVGSNFGLAAMYAAKKKSCKCLAFEPHFATHYILYKNVIANKLQSSIWPFQIALSSSNGYSTSFDLLDASAGRALNTLKLGKDINSDQVSTQIEDLKKSRISASNESRERCRINQSVHTTSLDSFISMFTHPEFNRDMPKHLKIDVDGLDLLVLAGAVNTLETVKSIYIEYIPQEVHLSALIPDFLAQFGFKIDSQNAENLILVKV